MNTGVALRRKSGEIIKMKISEEGKQLIMKFEGCVLEPYRCSAGVLTQGYGHTRTVVEGQNWSQEHAEEMLSHDLEEFEGYINELVAVPVKQSMFDALVAWCFNIGPTNAKSSSAIRLLNEGKYEEVPASMRLWNKITVNGQKEVSEGLVRRREAESLLFEGKDWTHI